MLAGHSKTWPTEYMCSTDEGNSSIPSISSRAIYSSKWTDQMCMREIAKRMVSNYVK